MAMSELASNAQTGPSGMVHLAYIQYMVFQILSQHNILMLSIIRCFCGRRLPFFVFSAHGMAEIAQSIDIIV
jgi:hypothetical protein